MKRFLISWSAVVIVALFAATDAYAICQTCRGALTADAQCVTLTMCEQGANMSACVEKDRIMSGTYLEYCDSMGTEAGPECNGADASCHTGGGNSGGGNTGGGSTGGSCTVSGGEVCPAQCASCGTRNNDCFCE